MESIPVTAGLVALAIVAMAVAAIVWRITGTANRGLKSASDVATSLAEAARPVSAGAGELLRGGAHILHGSGEMVHAIAERLRDKQRERVQLASENASLHAEIEQLKSRRVNSVAVERQLQVVFFSVQSKYTSFRQQSQLEDAGDRFGISRNTHLEFIGVIEAEFVAKLGIDLKRLQFKLEGASTVHVHGAQHVQSVGLVGLDIKDRFSERRRVFKSSSLLSGEIEVLPTDEKLLEECRQHSRDVLREVQNSDMATSLAEVNQKVALSFFQALMGGGRYVFLAAPEPLENPFGFEQLCSEMNRSLQEQIGELEAARDERESRAVSIDKEIIELAVERIELTSQTALINSYE